MTHGSVDVAVVGSGPNALAAAVTLARAGLQVRVHERSAVPGGGAATRESTLPGFRHDVGSAVHPLAFESGFFRAFGLSERVAFATPEISFAQPLDGERAALAYRDLDRTAAELGRDGAAYARLLRPLSARSSQLARVTGSSLLELPRHPVTAARLALRAAEQGTAAWNARFDGEEAPALVTGVAAHAILAQPSMAAAGAGLVLHAYAHARGWPIPLGGSGAIIDALLSDLRAHGGELVCDHEVTSLDELEARAVVLDVTPRALVRLAGGRMPDRYRRALETFRYGNAVAKIDFALSAPVPWSNPGARRAGTLHLGGTRAEMAAAENAVLAGRLPERPYVLVSQPSLFDPSRAPAGAHTLWAYTHVPAGSAADRTRAVTAQIERFAPGFSDTILASSSRTAGQLASQNPNWVGGDISAGALSLGQLLRRPVLSRDPWRTPMAGVYLTGASTTPGPGVHGLSGWYAARSVLRGSFGIRAMPSLAP